jgi:hypothetical protein
MLVTVGVMVCRVYRCVLQQVNCLGLTACCLDTGLERSQKQPTFVLALLSMSTYSLLRVCLLLVRFPAFLFRHPACLQGQVSQQQQPQD